MTRPMPSLPPDASRWTRLAYRGRMVAERYGMARRLPAAVLDQATTKHIIADLVYRRAGAEGESGTTADDGALRLALRRAPGWTPGAIASALATERIPDTTIADGLVSLADNPAAAVTWLQEAALIGARVPTQSWAWRAWIARLRTTGLPGWTADGPAWRALVAWGDAVHQRAEIHREPVDGPMALADLMWITDQLAVDPEVTDDRLVELVGLVEDLERRMGSGTDARGPHPPSPRITALYRHPAAGVAMRAQFIDDVVHERWNWSALLDVRPDWIAAPDIQGRIDTLAPESEANEAFFRTYAHPEALVRRWQRVFQHHPYAGLATIGQLPMAALALLTLSAHDIQQCLLHTPDAEMRLSLIGALAGLPATTPDHPPTAFVVEAPWEYPNMPRPVINPALSAHDPVVREWLADRDPGYQDYTRALQLRRDEKRKRDEEEARARRKRREAEEARRRRNRHPY